MKTGIELIAIERQEQIEKHGRTIAKDVIENPNEELKYGAMAALEGYEFLFPIDWADDICRIIANKSYRKRLIIAGALIAAEIDRIQNR